NAARHIAHGVRRSALSDARDASLRIDHDQHVALRERLRTVRIVVGRIVEANLRYTIRGQQRGLYLSWPGWQCQHSGRYSKRLSKFAAIDFHRDLRSVSNSVLRKSVSILLKPPSAVWFDCTHVMDSSGGGLYAY